VKPPRGPLKERRSLSTVRAPGRIDADGDRALASALAEALADARDREIADSLTHPFHTYPARMHPATSKRLVEIVMQGRPHGVILDPFCGSGTTLVEARAAGLKAIGVDLNPLAALLARTKTWTAPAPRRRQLLDAGRRLARDTLAEVKSARRATHEPTPLRAPAGFDPNARNRRLARWFAPHVRRELEYMAARIDEVRASDAEIGDALFVALSAVLYKVSSRASDTDPSWVERAVARGAASRLFVQRIELLCAGLDDLARTPGPLPEVIEADARTLVDRLGAGSVAGVVTSPPYAGTYDYAEQHRLRFDFLGIRHRAFDEGEIGARRAFNAGDWTEDERQHDRANVAAAEARKAARRNRDTRPPDPRRGRDAGPGQAPGRRTVAPNYARAEADERLARAYARADARTEAERQWRRDLASVIDMVSGLLVPGGRAALILGDSLAGGHAMYADDDVRATLGDDLALVAWAAQTRPMLGGGERRAFGDRPKREHVILLVKR
jgi:hypothetical protein